jgi:hypothetical protein
MTISTMRGWGERRNKEGHRANFLDANRDEILADCKNVGIPATANKWDMDRTSLNNLLSRWRMAGYEVPNTRRYSKQIVIQEDRSLTIPKDMGCAKATKFLGRQSHCITLDKNREIDIENSCPFEECLMYKGDE